MSSLASALGLVLLHFVWQGLVLGALVAIALAAFRDRAASERYAICVAGMIALLAAPAATAVLVLRAAPGSWESLALPAFPGASAASRLASPVLPVLPWLTATWAAGATTLQIRMAASWWRADRLRRAGTRAAPARWRREFEALRACLGVTGPVRLLESPSVLVPSVVGWLRPVVLVPASLATGLPAEQIRGLLAHELAHVRRHDYLVNVGQCLVESLLFFHPVTWWLSGRLRAEREFCCDDVAVTVAGGALVYARTLSSLEERRDRTALPLLSSKGGTLMTRITRILGDRAGGRSRTALALGIVSAIAGIGLGSLMASGCFQGETADASTGLTGPAGVPSDAALPALDPAPAEAILGRLEQAVAAGTISETLGAFIRERVESGAVLCFAASCSPEDAGEIPCPPSDCTPAACLELAGSGESGRVCLVIECDETDCAALGEGVSCDTRDCGLLGT